MTAINGRRDFVRSTTATAAALLATQAGWTPAVRGVKSPNTAATSVATRTRARYSRRFA